MRCLIRTLLLLAFAVPSFAADFAVQRGTTILDSGETSRTLTADIDYTAPSGAAFVRIVNTRLSGSGRTAGGGKQNTNRWMTWLSAASDLTSSFSIARFSGTGDNAVSWELIEYTGASDGADAFSVLAVGTQSFGSLDLAATSLPVAGVIDDPKVVVFVTGQAADSSSSDSVNQAMTTTEWAALQDTALFTRGSAGAAATVSYAVIEFTGANWSIQRIEHNYSAAGVGESESIMDLGDIERGFLHVQHRSFGSAVNQQGAEVWLSSPSAISFLIDSSAGTPSGIDSVAWLIGNTGSSARPLRVRHYSGTRLTEGPEQDVWIDTVQEVATTSETSIMGESGRSEGGGDDFPRGSIRLLLSDIDQVTLAQSDSGGEQNYRFSVVEWPDSTSVSVPTSNYIGRVALVLTLVFMSIAVLSRRFHSDRSRNLGAG